MKRRGTKKLQALTGALTTVLAGSQGDAAKIEDLQKQQSKPSRSIANYTNMEEVTSGWSGESDSTIPTYSSAIKSLQTQRALVSAKYMDKYEQFLETRQKLAFKKFNEGLNPREEILLKKLEHRLDLIEDAKHGHTLDQLEFFIHAQHNVASSIFALVDEVKNEQQPRKGLNESRSQFGSPTKKRRARG